MAAMKTMREKMADDGLTSFIVTYKLPPPLPGEFRCFGADDDEPLYEQFWAEDSGHAGEQMDDANPGCEVVLVETQDEYEARTGVTLPYGRGKHR